jgi:mannose-6-phosphate isomerase-like protein (cupin superfamily)
MTDAYSLKNLAEVEDSAPKFGLGEVQEARFANDDLDVDQTGLSYHRLKPGKRQGFGHRHEKAEEVYVVLSGSGRIKLDDEVVELRALDAIRLAPRVSRALEAGPEGLEVLAFGPRHAGDGQLLRDWWTD